MHDLTFTTTPLLYSDSPLPMRISANLPNFSRLLKEFWLARKQDGGIRWVALRKACHARYR